MKTYIELTSRPLLHERNTISSPVGLLAARLHNLDECIELRYIRGADRIRCFVSVESAVKKIQVKTILSEFNYGFLDNASIPDLLTDTILFKNIIQKKTSVRNRQQLESREILQLAKPFIDISYIIPEIMSNNSYNEQLFYALSQMDEGTGFSVFIKQSGDFSNSVRSMLKEATEQEDDIYHRLLNATMRFNCVICVYSNSDEQKAFLIDELMFAFPGLSKYIFEKEFDIGTIWSQVNLFNESIPKTLISELQMTYLLQEVVSLSNMAGIPRLRGIDINKDSLFEKQQVDEDISESTIMIGHNVNGDPQYVSLHALCQHMFIAGAPGTGKGNLIFLIAQQLHEKHVPMLLIESAKEEQHHLQKRMPKLKVWRPIGGEFLLNPFELPPNIKMGEYRSSILQIMRVCFKAEGPLEELYRTTLSRCFARYGYIESSKSNSEGIRPFGLSEFITEYNRLLLTNGYSERAKSDLRTGGIARLRTLFDQNPDVFDTVNSIPIDELTHGENLLQLNCLTTIEAKQLFCTLILIQLGAWLRLNGKHRRDPSLVIILDESHNLLQGIERSDGEEYSFARDFQNLLLEMRSLGVCFIVADQSSENLPRGISDVCATKVFLGPSGYSGIERYASDLKADDVALNNLYLLKAGEGIWKTYGMSSGAYFISPNVIDEYNLQEKCIPQNEYVFNNKEFMCQTYLECKYCLDRDSCSLQLKEDARIISSRLIIDMQQSLARALQEYYRLRGANSNEELIEASERRVSNIIKIIIDRIKGHYSTLFGHCCCIQFVRQFNRESSVVINEEWKKYMNEEIKKRKR